MTVDEAIKKAYQESKGKPVPPASGTTKYNSLLILADSFQKLWASEPGIEWDSLYQEVDIGVVTATNTFDLDDSINYIVKREITPIYTLNSDSTIRTNYPVVRPNQLYLGRGSSVVAQAGRSLVFADAFTTDSANLGHTIYVPSMVYPDDITTGSDEIQVDDPMWLVMMMAADFIRNDLVRQNQYDRIVAYAAQIMQKMKENNRGQYEQVDMDWSPLGGEDVL